MQKLKIATVCFTKKTARQAIILFKTNFSMILIADHCVRCIESTYLCICIFIYECRCCCSLSSKAFLENPSLNPLKNPPLDVTHCKEFFY